MRNKMLNITGITHSNAIQKLSLQKRVNKQIEQKTKSVELQNRLHWKINYIQRTNCALRPTFSPFSKTFFFIFLLVVPFFFQLLAHFHQINIPPDISGLLLFVWLGTLVCVWVCVRKRVCLCVPFCELWRILTPSQISVYKMGTQAMWQWRQHATQYMLFFKLNLTLATL